MHELSLAISLVETVCDELPRLGATICVRAVRVQVGQLSGVAPEALRAAFDVAAGPSAIAGARLDIEEMPVAIYCATCAARQVVTTAWSLTCPVCHTPGADVLSGRELRVVALEVTDDATDRGRPEEHPQEE